MPQTPLSPIIRLLAMAKAPIMHLLDYWKGGGWSLITETQQAHIAYSYRVLSECLLAAIAGSWLGNIYDRKTWDVFNMCKVLPVAFFFLPNYRDSRRMHWRQHIALVVASFALAFGRIPTRPKFTDTYRFGLHLLPAIGIPFLARYRFQTYEKWRFLLALWITIASSLYAGCPIFVNILECVSFRQYARDCLWVAIWYVVNVEVVIILYALGWNHMVLQVLVPLFFQTGGWKIVFRIFFGFLFCGIVYWANTDMDSPPEVIVPWMLFAVIGTMIYLISLCARNIEFR